MKSAFNRARTSQTIWKVVPAKSFQPNHRSNTRLRKHNAALHEIAAYFPAYAVEDDWIDTLEALLVRAFPNALTNVKMAALVGGKTTRQVS
jgi:pyruvate-formate lyase